MADMKPAVFNLTLEDRAWIKKSTKEFKANGESEFMRIVIGYLRETDIKDLRDKMQRTRIENELNEARRKSEEYQKKQELLESQLEALSA